LRLDCGDNVHQGGKGGKIRFTDISVYNSTAEIIARREGVSGSSHLEFSLRDTVRLGLFSSGAFTTTPAAGGHAVFNSDGVNADFRVASDNLTHALFVDGGGDSVNVGNSGGKQTISRLHTRGNGANIEFGHGNNSAGYFGTLGSFGNNGMPYIGFSTACESSVNTFSTFGHSGYVINGNLLGDLLFQSVGSASATGQTPSRRMEISAGGNIASQYGSSTGYSQTSGYGGMHYQNDNGSTGGALILTNNANRGWSNIYLNKFDWASGKDVRSIQFTVNGGVVGTIGTTSTATAYNTSSDYRLKENVVPMTGSIDRLKALKPSQFNFIVDSDTTVDGFLAHEAQEVVPESVTGAKDAMRDEEYEVTAAVEEVRDEDDNITTEAVEAVMGTRSVPDMQGIDQSKLVPLLVSALQEAIARIEILEGV